MRARRISKLVLLVALLGGAALAQPRALTTQPAFRLIVHPGNGASGLERRFIADAFLKKTTRWPNGEVIRPVDLGPSSPIRHSFSEEVLGRTVDAVKSYWQQAIFSGRDVPPPEFDSEDDVVKYVLKHPGALGYVSTSVNLAGAKVVSLR